MGRIFITSDTHFGHDREFLYGPRGFSNIDDHDKAVIQNWNSVVQPDDTVYHLGDVMLNDNDHGMECLRQLNGTIIIVPGNHDTDTRLALYATLPNVKVIQSGIEGLKATSVMLKYRKYNFYLSHQPTMTSNLDADPHLRANVLNLYGHTHQQSHFYEDRPYMFHAGLDSNNNTPVLLDDAIEMMKVEVQKCLDMLQTTEKEEEVCPTQSGIWTIIVQRVKKLFSKR